MNSSAPSKKMPNMILFFIKVLVSSVYFFHRSYIRPPVSCVYSCAAGNSSDANKYNAEMKISLKKGSAISKNADILLPFGGGEGAAMCRVD